jgi:hypothetical protein
MFFFGRKKKQQEQPKPKLTVTIHIEEEPTNDPRILKIRDTANENNLLYVTLQNSEIYTAAGFDTNDIPTYHHIDVSKTTGEIYRESYQHIATGQNFEKVREDACRICDEVTELLYDIDESFSSGDISACDLVEGIEPSTRERQPRNPILVNVERLTSSAVTLRFNPPSPKGMPPKYLVSARFIIEMKRPRLKDLTAPSLLSPKRKEEILNRSEGSIIFAADYLLDGSVGKADPIFWYRHIMWQISMKATKANGLQVKKIVRKDCTNPAKPESAVIWPQSEATHA